MERVSGPCERTECDAQVMRDEFASASNDLNVRGNDTASVYEVNLVTGRAALASVSSPLSGRSVQSLHSCSGRFVTLFLSSWESLQHAFATSQDCSNSTPPSPQKHNTMPSTPADADAIKTASATRYTVKAFTRRIIAGIALNCQGGMNSEKCEQSLGARLIPTSARQ